MFVIEGINDLKTLSDVIGGELFSNNEPFTGITTDSREEVNGAVYLALKGESFDGDIFCKDAIDNGYDGGISIEPHMAVVFHDKDSEANEEDMFNNYVEYGRRLEALIKQIKNN